MFRTASIASSLPLSVSNVISHRFVPNLCTNVTKVVARSPLFPLFSFLDSITLPKVLKTVRTVSSLTADESPETLSVCPGMNSYSQLKLYEIVPRLAQVASTSATTKRLFSLIDRASVTSASLCKIIFAIITMKSYISPSNKIICGTVNLDVHRTALRSMRADQSATPSYVQWNSCGFILLSFIFFCQPI